MPAYCVSKPSTTFRRQDLARRIRLDGVEAIVACSAYARAQVLCYFAPHSSKCSKCTCKGVSCDGSFSAADYNKLSEE
jgi:hypothetical protein